MFTGLFCVLDILRKLLSACGRWRHRHKTALGVPFVPLHPYLTPHGSLAAVLCLLLCLGCNPKIHFLPPSTLGARTALHPVCWRRAVCSMPIICCAPIVKGFFRGLATISRCCGGRPIRAWCSNPALFVCTAHCARRCKNFAPIRAVKSASIMTLVGSCAPAPILCANSKTALGSSRRC